MLIPLGHVARVSTGFPFRRKVESEPGGDLVLIQIKDINATEGVFPTGAVMLRSDQRNYDRYLLQAGDLLFQSRGSRHPATMVGDGLRGIAASGLHVVRPKAQRVLPEYLAWWLNHPQVQERLSREFAHGTHIPFVSKTDLEGLSVPVPSLEVQRRIVDAWRLQRETETLNTRLNELLKRLTDAVTLDAARKED